jgi:hypothetical protein
MGGLPYFLVKCLFCCPQAFKQQNNLFLPVSNLRENKQAGSSGNAFDVYSRNALNPGRNTEFSH